MHALFELFRDTLLRNWGLKLVAVGLAAVLFVLTRDEVTRTFEVPLRAIGDPDRVLLTDLPPSITVKVRGPWTRLSRMQDYDLGTAALDLRVADPGPLEVDHASIVMPSGVVLAEVQYPHVDLRFEPIIERRKRVAPAVLGEPAEGYRIVRTTVDPAVWAVRGGQSVVQGVTQLRTEPLEISGRTATVTQTLAVVPPGGDLDLVRDPGTPARVEVRVQIEPVMETRELSVPIPVPEGLDPTGAIPDSVSVQVSGPRLSFKALDELDLQFPVDASVVPRAKADAGEPEGTDAGMRRGKVVELRFGWSEAVPSAVASALSIDHGVETVVLPPPPAPPEEPPV